MQRRPKRVGPYCRSQLSTLFLLLSALILVFSMKRNDMFFDKENWLEKSNIGTFWHLPSTPILKIFLILYPPLENSTTPLTILSRGSEEGFGRKFCHCMMPKSQPRLTAKPLNSLSATHSWFFAYDATKIWQKSWKKLSIVAVQYGRTGVEFSRGGELERFLPKNLHTQRIFFDFENWPQ